MSKETTVAGPSFLTLLGLLFIALKLMGYIHWSWWWVLAPIWIPMAIGLTVIIGVFIHTIINRDG